ncbi:F-box/kelch-repeat protein At3g06240-like [Momordica charantia]|uniref:F-box/kelch-repeat protein At3g06240-like n=1 Tax=Momordica charantia TaxID=3673 RepID=A0A6J1D9N5_MOMCH|nr:F-box/kelch-repeat protein At3g06240-like [Momordica charantia]XP_022150328.1 F-box/kelch-repeat protein At3g06240-like [Momordica charantia]
MASLGNLPEDVMMEILKRLPSECVGRFRCVSKYWYALINDPEFADSLQHRSLLVKRTVIRNEESGEKQTMLSSLKFPLASAAVVDMDLPLSEDFEYYVFSGYSHGLICLSDNLDNIFICNPATGELRHLPPSILLTKPPEDPFDRNGTSMNAVGFGYDQKSMDFKVVRVVEFYEEGRYPCLRTEVYDLGNDGWREIESRACGFVVSEPSSFDMYHEGMYYWIAEEEGEGGSEIIQWFDMSEEVFGRIPLPQGFLNDIDKYISMCVWKGRIVLLLYNPEFSETTIEIWAMDNKNFNLWAKVFTIDPVSGIEMPLVFVSSVELVMVDKEGHLILYNLNTQRFLHLPLKGDSEQLAVTVFVKTLLSVN